MNEDGHQPYGRSGKDPWRIIGTILAVLAVITGLVIVGTLILFLVALNSVGSNK